MPTPDNPLNGIPEYLCVLEPTTYGGISRSPKGTFWERVLR